MVAENQNLYDILFPYAIGRADEVIKRNQKFVHYTFAEVAMSIIKNKAIWMRNSRMMNDTSEVHHGIACVKNALKSAVGEQFKSLLNSRCNKIFDEAYAHYDRWKTSLTDATYLTCISEHDATENQLGRLSMWRAYGDIAIVMNNPVFLTDKSDALKAYTSPVIYSPVTDGEFQAEFAKMVGSVERNIDFLANNALPQRREELLRRLFFMLMFAALSTKHIAFKEEREWRIIYSPDVKQSDIVEDEIVVIRGVIQRICKIPLTDMPTKNFIGASIPSLIDHIIIGPTQQAGASREAFVSLLGDAGVQNPESKVIISTIPLRT